MKTASRKSARLVLALGLVCGGAQRLICAQDAPSLEIALHPVIRVTGEVGSTYVIESKNGADDDFWLTRGWIDLTTPTAQWTDPVPADAPRRIYRAAKVDKPAIRAPTNMVWIPPGRFTIGSPETERGRWDGEGPQTRVELTKGFWMGKYETTQREYLAVMGNNPSKFQPPDHAEGLDRPVEAVSWADVVAYCQKLTEEERAAGRLPTGYVYRLPTEAEWEYACRAGTTTRFSFGDALDCDGGCGYCALADSYMSWCGNWTGQTDPVGGKLPNAWGLHDMHGNVKEWCQDWFDLKLCQQEDGRDCQGRLEWLSLSSQYPGGAVVDPQGSTTGSYRVFRGGGAWPVWNGYAWLCSSARRSGISPGDRRGDLGFRVILAPGQP